MLIILNQPGKDEAMAEIGRLLHGVPEDEQEPIVRKYLQEHNLLFKDILAQPQPLPRHIMGITNSSVILSATVSKIQGKSVQLIYGPVQGGPYSFLGQRIKGDGTFNQPLVSRIENLHPGTTYFYVVQLLDEDGTIINQTGESAFTTLSHAPRIKKAVDVRTTSAVITAIADHVLPSQNLRVIYGTDALDQSVEVRGVNESMQTLTLTPNLEAGTTYYYRAQVVGPMGVIEESEEREFTTLPYTATSAVSNIRATSVTVSGSADFVPTNHTIELVCSGLPVISALGNNTKSQTIQARTPLKELTSYKLKTRVRDQDKVLYESEELEFETLSHNAICLPATQVKACTALISGTVDWAEGSIELCVNDGLVAKIPGHNSEGQIIQTHLMDLSPGTEYTYNLVVDGKKSKTKSFKTSLNTPQTLGAINIKDRTATLMGFADFVPQQGFAQFWWGTQSGQKTNKSQLLFGSNTENQEFGFMAYGLEPNTLYYYSLVILGSDGETILDSSEEDTFTTAEAIYYRKRV